MSSQNAVVEFRERLENLNGWHIEATDILQRIKKDYENIENEFDAIVNCLPQELKENIHIHGPNDKFLSNGFLYHDHSFGLAKHYHNMFIETIDDKDHFYDISIPISISVVDIEIGYNIIDTKDGIETIIDHCANAEELSKWMKIAMHIKHKEMLEEMGEV